MPAYLYRKGKQQVVIVAHDRRVARWLVLVDSGLRGATYAGLDQRTPQQREACCDLAYPADVRLRDTYKSIVGNGDAWPQGWPITTSAGNRRVYACGGMRSYQTRVQMSELSLYLAS